MRAWHWLYAYLGGYFWLPCPVCGRMFGGHQAAKGPAGTLFHEDPERNGQVTCPKCPHDYLEREGHVYMLTARPGEHDTLIPMMIQLR